MTTTKRLLSIATAILLICSMVFSLCACGKKEKDVKTLQQENVKETLSELKTALNELGNQETEIPAFTGEGTFGIELGDFILEILENNTDMDFEWLNDLEFSAEIAYNDMLAHCIITFMLGKDELVTADVYMDIENGEFCVSLGDYSNDYYGIETDMPEMDVELITSQYTDIIEKLDVDTLFSLIEKYAAVVFELYADSEKYDATLEANGVSQDCIAYEVALTEDDIIAFAENLLETIIDDEDLADYFLYLAEEIGDLSDDEAEEAYDEFIEELENALDSVEDIDFGSSRKPVLTHISYVYKNEIIGNEITVNVEDQKINVFAATATDGADTGVEVVIATKGAVGLDVIEIYGEYSEVKGLRNGEYEISILGNEALFVSIENLDAKKLEEGFLNGTITVTLGEDFIAMLNSLDIIDPDFTAIIEEFDELSLEITAACDKETNDVAVSIADGKDVILSVFYTVTAKEEETSIKFPSSSKITTDVMEWITEENLEDFIENLEDTDLPEEILDLLKLAMG